MVLEKIKKFKICEPAFIDQYLKAKQIKRNTKLIEILSNGFAVIHYCDGRT